MRFRAYSAFALAPAAWASAGNAQQRPALRALGTVVAKSTQPLGNITIVPAGAGVLVNDITNRRVIRFDSTLATFTVVADTTAATGNSYPSRFPAALIRYKGDSSLLIDPQSQSMLVIDPAGSIGRVMAVPSSQDAIAMGLPGAGFDGRGHIIYRGTPRSAFRGLTPNGPITQPEFPDSAPILRIDLGTRVRDTLSWMRVQKLRAEVRRSDEGSFSITTRVDPLPVVDEMVLLADGSLALIRGRDYHIDFVSPDGSRVSAPRIPFDWQRLTDEDKSAFIDSVQAARERMGNSAPAVNVGGSRSPAQLSLIPASELPDYKPPFFAGAARADTEGNIWVRTIPTKAITGGPVYDVIDHKGLLVERVQIPPNNAIVGFASGVVYMTVREGDSTFLQRARIR